MLSSIDQRYVLQVWLGCGWCGWCVVVGGLCWLRKRIRIGWCGTWCGTLVGVVGLIRKPRFVSLTSVKEKFEDPYASSLLRVVN
jgi:hypothetical protein